MTNRFRQGLFNRLNELEEEIKEGEKIEYEKLEKAENLRSELEDKKLLTEEEYEKLESEIEEISE